MDFGLHPALNINSALPPDPIRRLAWFERSSPEHRLPEKEHDEAEDSSALDELRQAPGLVYPEEAESES